MTGAATIQVHLKNSGPKPFSGTILVVCAGHYYQPAQPDTVAPVGSGDNINVGLAVGTGTWINTRLVVYPQPYI